MGEPEQASGQSWVMVALVLRPHGLKGVMRLKPMTRQAEELIDAPVEKFHVRQGRKISGPLTREEFWMGNKILYARFAEVPDRTAAEQFVNGELLIREEDLWEQPEETYYIHDLEGMDVVDHATGTVLGSVRTAQEGTAHDFLILDLEGVAGSDTLLPLIPLYVPEVNVTARKVRVNIPDGLLDL
ncbi:MAG: rRNA processing protein RimM [Candidatus Sumerlaeota bacterium]|nr:rRNA processing protein RimM [Candidatus Sumerlaeota bacterium]